MKPPRKPPAKISRHAGIAAIAEMVRSIDENPDLSRSEFGQSVREHLVSMKSRLTDGGYFSEAMEAALNSWNVAIHKWERHPREVDNPERLQ